MNPNLNFGQGVPGREAGRGPGIIDTRAFMLVLDAVELFDEENWSADDQKKLQSWFDKFQQWLKDCLLYTSPSPRDQRGSRMPSSA